MTKVISAKRYWPARLAASLLLFALPALQAAQVYQWVDESGQTVYSDQPPPDRDARQLQMPAGPSAEQVEAADRRTEALEQQADELAAERRRRDEQRAAATAQPPADGLLEDTYPAHDVDQSDYYDYPQQVPRPVRPAQPQRPVQLPAQPARPVLPRPAPRPAASGR